MTIEIHVEGVEEVFRKMSFYTPKAMRHVIKPSIRKGATTLRGKTKQAAPKDTGQMSRAIISRVAKRRGKRDNWAMIQFFNTRKYPALVKFAKSGPKTRVNPMAAKTGRRSFYPSSIEYGRAAMYNAGGPKVVKPKPYARGTFKDNATMIGQQILSQMKAKIRKHGWF